MWHWFAVVCLFMAGYGLAASAFGLNNETAARRVGNAVFLGAAVVLLLVPALLVFALSGGFPRMGSISLKVWSFIIGGSMAGAVSLYKARGEVRGWFNGGGVRRAAVAGLGVVLISAAGFGLAMIGRDAPEKRPAPVVVEQKAAPAVVKVESAPAVACDCAAGAVCVGPRGGRYCLRPDGSKKYQP